MPHAALTVLLPLLFLAGGAHATPAQPLGRTQALQALDAQPAQARREAAERLGEIGAMADAPALLRALRDADAATRANAEQALWRIWGRSGDGQVDRLYRLGVAQMNHGKLRRGIATFSRIVRLKPDFAEGWNKRATLYYLAGEYRKSLADCAEVLKRNPQHFGALAGCGQIYLRLEDYQRALDYFRRALELNPNLQGVRADILVLEQLLEQQRRNMI